MNKLKVYGSEKCPDCPPVLKILDKKNIEYEFINITDSISNLKEFLEIRDNNEAFRGIRENGNVGIPCFVKDNKIYFEVEKVL